MEPALPAGDGSTVDSVTADTPPAHEPTLGALVGSASTEGGAAVYRVPVVVPPGRAGMQPELALVYNSRGGDGVLGVGWSIAGLTSVHRCPQTPEQDGRSRGVSYATGADGDRLCLDGERLVATSGTYGAANTTYATEIDRHARITQVGTALNGSATCFKVEEKSGRILHYGAVVSGSSCAGGAPLARVQPGGAPAALSWLLVKVEDRVGNQMLYSYTDLGNGEVLPSRIDYTGFGSTAGDRSVQFDYVTRTAAASGASDVASSYLAGGLTMQTRALGTIRTQIGTANVRTLTPAYIASAYSGRLLLRTLTECAYEGTTARCHPPTRFSLATSPLQASFTGLSDLHLPGLDGTTNEIKDVRILGDFDGDGTRETQVTVQQSDGQHVYLAQLTGDHVAHSAVDVTATPLWSPPGTDFDGDGRAETLRVPKSAADPQIIRLGVWNLPRGAVATGNPFAWTATDVPYAYGNINLPEVADVDGDGRLDLVVTQATASCGSDSSGNKEGVFVYRNAIAGALGTATAHFVAPSAPLFCLARSGSGAATVAEKINRIADVDGDGLPDFFISTIGGGSSPTFQGVRLTQRSGSTLSTTLRSCAGLGLTDAPGQAATDDCHWTLGQAVHWIDVNGDGLDDFVIAHVGGQWQVRLNRGGTFTVPFDTGSTAGLDTHEPRSGEFRFRYAGRLPPMDVDGDGKPELLVVSAARGFALKLCAFFSVHPLTNPANECPDAIPGNQLDAVACAAYACPENPGGGLNMPPNQGTAPVQDYPATWYDPEHPDRDYPVFGLYKGGPSSSGLSESLADHDRSLYYVDALKFVQTSATSIQVRVVPTPLASSLNAVADDLYGDGLPDLLLHAGGAPATVHLPGDSADYRAHLVVADGTYGPTTLPDGTPICTTSGSTTTCPLQEHTRPYVNLNTGANAFSTTLAGVPSMEDAPWLLNTTPSYLPELLRAVQDGTGDYALWAYAPLASGIVQGSGASALPLYSIDSGTGYVDGRHYYFTSSMPVVDGMTANNGIGGETGARSAVYGYGAAIYHHLGRGFQGFRTITSWVAGLDASRQTRTTTTYHQKFPLTGRVETVRTYRPPSGSQTVDTAPTLAQEADTWICTLATRGACPTGDGLPTPPAGAGGQVYAPVLDRQHSERRERATGASTDHVVSTTDTVNAATATGGASGWDAYGNLLKQVVTVADAGSTPMLASHVTTTTDTYAAADLTNWWLDQLTQHTVTQAVTYASGHALPSGASAPSQTVNTAYAWNADRTLRTRTLQNGVANQRSTTVQCYPQASATTSPPCPQTTPSTSYGLPTLTKVCLGSYNGSGTCVGDVAAALGPERTTAFTYTRDGSSAAADGYFVRSTTNALGQTTTTTRRPSDGQVLVATDPNGVQSVTSYDAYGRATLEQRLGNTGSAFVSPVQRAWTSCLDGSSQPGHCGAGLVGEDGNEAWAAWRVTEVSAGYPTRVTWYDTLGRVVKQGQRGFDSGFIATLTDYDEYGTVADASTPYKPGQTAYFTGWTYDALNRPTQKLSPGAELDPTHGNVRTDYGYVDNRTTIKVRGTNVSSTCTSVTNLCMDMSRTHDALGRLQRTTQNNGSTANYAVTDYWTDGPGNAVAVRDAGGSVIKASYDALGRRTSVSDPDAGSSTFSYDALGELLTQTDARGVVTAVTGRDALGRLTQRTATDATAVSPLPKVIRDTWAYDPTGSTGGIGLLDYARRETGASTGSLTQIQRETDRYEAATKRLSTRTQQLDGQASAWVTSHGYDSAGRLWTVGYPDGTVVRRGYTTYGELAQLADDATGQAWWTATAQDAWGRVTAENYAGGLSGSHQTYASTGQWKQQAWSTAGASVDQWDYAYDSFGNLASQSRGSLAESYAYDGLQRLVQATRSGVSGSPPAVTYQYQATGNLSFKSDNSQATTGAYQYGGNGCGPHAVSQVTGVSSVQTYACDASGNVVGGNQLTGTYDFQNLAWTVTRSGAGTAQFAYGADGSRFREVASSHTTWFGAEGYERTQAGSATTERIELGPLVVVRTNGTRTLSAQLRDRLGSTVLIRTIGGLSSGLEDGGNGPLATAPNMRSYDAFGAVRGGNFSDRPSGTLAELPVTLRGFTGHEHVDDVRLIHMNGRMYDAALGRFLSVDPIIGNALNTQAINPYSYIGNNPLSGKDPSGYIADTDSICFRSPGSCGQIYGTDAIAALKAVSSGGQQGGNGMDGGLTSKGAPSTPGSGSASDIGGNNVIGKQLAQVAEPRAEGRAEEAGREAETDPTRSAIRRDSLRQRGISPAAAPLVENEAREERDRLVAEMQMYEPNYRAPNTVGAGGEANNPIDQRDTVKEDLARARAEGGVYLLRDPASGDVMRSGRTNDFNRRQSEHRNDPAFKGLEFEPLYRTDVYKQQRGLEQFTHEQYQPPLNRINPISPTNPRRQEYFDAAHDYLEDHP